MTSSGRDADDLGIAATCSTCATIFQGRQDTSRLWHLFDSDAIGSIEPQRCRICAIIWARHQQWMEGNNDQADNAAQLEKVAYIVMQDLPEQESPGAAVEIRLQLVYTNALSQYIELILVPANFDLALEIAEILPPTTAAEESIQFLMSKLRQCQESHQTCRRMSDVAWHPSRLLKIEGPGYATVSLCNGSELTSQPYITLSHCWGNTKPTQLTAGTEASLRAGILTGHLPRTFQDAIMIAHRLSVRYIWIDSMCIFQDDLQDWSSEAGTMCEVYSRALCNIAATGAEDSSVGLFFERSPVAECSFWVHAKWSDPKSTQTPEAELYRVFPSDQWTKHLELGPLNRRAWVMQERFLSARVLHFTKSQIFWECLESNCCEVFPDAIPPGAQPVWYLDPQRPLRKRLANPQTGEEWRLEVYKAWRTFALAYSRCRLSKDGDKLVAINGIQQLLSRVSGDRLIAGLWRSHFIEELCWVRGTAPLYDDKRQAPERFYPREWHAPSWSWAGTNVEAHPGQIRHHVNCLNFQIRVNVEAVDVEASNSGELKHASLKLRGKLVQATYASDPVDRTSGLTAKLVCGNSSVEGPFPDDRLDFSVALDDPGSNQENQEDLVLLGMYSCHCAEFGLLPAASGERLEALALKVDDAGSSQYRRVGMVTVRGGFYNFYMSQETKVEQTITII